MAESPRGKTSAAPRRAFTLLELILVMALLAIAATMVATRLTSFFRGRTLDHEARRLLALTHYAHSRAVAEGVPMMLWINPGEASYGLTAQAGYTETDEQALTFALDPDLKIEAPIEEALATLEANEKPLGQTTGLAVIRFNPDGFIDEISLPRIVLRYGDTAAIQIGQTANLLGYEIQPLDANPTL